MRWVSKTNWQETDGAVVGEPETLEKQGYSVVFTYKVEGHFYSGTFITTHHYRDGDALSVRYDASDPSRNDLVQKDIQRRWLLAGIYGAVALMFLMIWLATR